MVQAVRERCSALWYPEDVYAAIHDSRALLHLSYDPEGAISGCMVTRKIQEWGEEMLEVWVCWHSEPGLTIADYWDEVVALASALGLARIRTAGPRANDKVLPMTALYTVFEYEVPSHGQ